MRTRLTFLSVACLLLTGCGVGQSATAQTLCDPLATAQTTALYRNLFAAVGKGLFFGHQDDLAYGVNWRYEPGRSDVKDVVGDYPAVYGWDLGGLEKQSATNIDGIPFDKMRQFIIDGHKRGGIITISWHMDNPLTGKNAWDTTQGSLASVLPGGSKQALYVEWLDRAVQFLKTLKDGKGQLIPVLYRPFHELTGDWFWWCRNNGTPEQFQQLWKFTVDYLRQKGLHNLIYVYNTSDFNSKEGFLQYYPGSDYADVLSFDCYDYAGAHKDGTTFVQQMKQQLGIMDEIAREQHKLTAIAETGLEQIPDKTWWTGTLRQALGDYKVSYVLVWRNHGWNEWLNPPRMHYYAPYKDQVSAPDFVEFYKQPDTFFEKDAKALQLYKP